MSYIDFRYTEPEKSLHEIINDEIKQKIKKATEPLNVCVTGTFNLARQQVIEVLGKMGLNVHMSIQNDTNVLITGSRPGKTKLNVAHKNHMVVMTIKEFKEFYNINFITIG